MTAAKEATTQGDPVDVIRVERLGGLAGVGMGGSHLRSRGQVAWADLSAVDQTAITTLFTSERRPAAPHAHAPGDSAVRDGFRYRLTRITWAGGRELERVAPVSHDIEVPESQVPQALVNCVQDELD